MKELTTKQRQLKKCALLIMKAIYWLCVPWTHTRTNKSQTCGRTNTHAHTHTHAHHSRPLERTFEMFKMRPGWSMPSNLNNRIKRWPNEQKTKSDGDRNASQQINRKKQLNSSCHFNWPGKRSPVQPLSASIDDRNNYFLRTKYRQPKLFYSLMKTNQNKKFCSGCVFVTAVTIRLRFFQWTWTKCRLAKWNKRQ